MCKNENLKKFILLIVGSKIFLLINKSPSNNKKYYENDRNTKK